MYIICAIINFFRNLKNDERGLSGVVVAVLLILIAVLAVVLIWGFLSGWLAELWGQITGAAGGIS
jgi:flagellin-like protein